MRRIGLSIVCVLIPWWLGAQSADEIIRKSEDLLKGISSHGIFKMTVTTPDYTRTMEMESWWVGNEKALIVITAPKREAGNKTLKVSNELWLYLRNTETTMKIPPSMMLQSWMGSDFTNDDLVRESSIIEDYTKKVLLIEPVDGAPAWKIELMPKPTAPVVWGKICHWVRTADFLPARSEYYDEQGRLIRTLQYTDVRRFGKRMIPSRWTMRNSLKPDYRTEFIYLQAEFDIAIDDRVFSFRELEKGRSR